MKAGVAVTFLGGFLDSLLDDVEEAKIAVDEEDDRSDYDEDDFDLFVATDTAAIFVPDDESGGWSQLESTGEDPTLGAVVVENLRTKNIGVSAAVGSDQTVSTGTETKLNLDKVSSPYFDDFGELDESANKIVLEHGSHHEIVAHADMNQASAAGQIWLRVYVNEVQRARDHIDVKNGEDAVLECSIYLKLDPDDEIEVKVEHDTGSDETFPKDANFVSVVRQ
jgi:hypothetical protein